MNRNNTKLVVDMLDNIELMIEDLYKHYARIGEMKVSQALLDLVVEVEKTSESILDSEGKVYSLR